MFRREFKDTAARSAVPLLLLAVLGLSSCSVEQRLADVSADVELTFAQAKAWEELPLRTISWHQALSMIHNNNIELKQISSSIARYEREGLSVYTDMIPGLSYYGYITKTLNDLSGTYHSSDVNSNFNVTFNLPTLTNIPYRVYSSRANTFAAIKARELRERDLTSRLYSQIRNREIELKRRELEKSMPDSTEQSRMLRESAQRLADGTHWKMVADILGDHTARWQILPESMPRVKWSEYLPRFRNLDPLSVSRFAIRLEQSRLAQYGIALQYLPTINTNLYSPSLFSSTGGTYEGTFLSGEDTRLNLNASYLFDTQLDTWHAYRDRVDEYENTRRTVAADLMAHKHKLNQLRQSVLDYESWRSYMYKRMEYLKSTPVVTAEEQLLRDSTIMEMRMELLNQERQVVESEAAVILEYGLSSE